MWPHIGAHLLKGQLVVAKGDLKEALVELTHTLLDAQEGLCQVWAVCDDAAKRVIAAMVSEIKIEGGERVVWVTRMSGGDIMRWGKPMSDAMAAFAKAEGCKRYLFSGRKALLRAYRDVRIVGQHAEGVHLFERAVS
jgi:hypothetical protein